MADTDDLFARAVASALGVWPVLSDTPPEESTRHGVPVVWFNSAVPVDGVPAFPEAPVFDNAGVTYLVPLVTGVHYYVGGARLEPRTVHTARVGETVQVEARPAYGYVLPGRFVWGHDFPDPHAVTVLASDTFTGEADTIHNRYLDNTLGGTLALSYSNSSHAWSVHDGRATATPTGKAGWNTITAPGVQNLRLEFDLITPPSGHALYIYTAGGAANTGAGFYFDENGTRIHASGETSIKEPHPRTTADPGRYAVQRYGNTISWSLPDGTVHHHDITDTIAAAPTKYGHVSTIRTAGNLATAQQHGAITNLVLSRVGW